MIDRELKRALGQMTYGAHVVAATDGATTRAYTSTWTYQMSFRSPIIATSASPRHDTFPLIVSSGGFTVSVLAGDQIDEAQYFSYPAHKMRYAGDYLHRVEGRPVVHQCIAWMYADVFDSVEVDDHVLFLGRITDFGAGRLSEPGLTYSSRKGWRVADRPARTPGDSVRDRLLSMAEGTAGEEPDPSIPQNE